ncbi:hypothetical protein EI94DRAFT_1707097 [Lactarius quietus]|nr:hypothetical protein EI94DRAFT_1707097 [Lactarius quietus]
MDCRLQTSARVPKLKQWVVFVFKLKFQSLSSTSSRETRKIIMPSATPVHNGLAATLATLRRGRQASAAGAIAEPRGARMDFFGFGVRKRGEKSAGTADSTRPRVLVGGGPSHVDFVILAGTVHTGRKGPVLLTIICAPKRDLGLKTEGMRQRR